MTQAPCNLTCPDQDLRCGLTTNQGLLGILQSLFLLPEWKMGIVKIRKYDNLGFYFSDQDWSFIWSQQELPTVFFGV